MLDGLITAGRAAAESLMVDTCTIRRGGGEPVWSDAANDYTEPAGFTVYTGKCKVNTYQAFEQNPDVGERRWTVQRYYLHVPVGAGPFQPGDVATINTSVANPNLPGSVFIVSGLHDKSLQTAQRLLVDEVTA